MSTPTQAVPEAGPARAPVPRAALADALRALLRAFQRTSMYPANHPAIPAALRDAERAFRSVLAATPAMTIGVTSRGLMLGDEPIEDESRTVHSFARLLHGLDVAAIDLQAGLDATELERFVGRLRAARAGPIKGQALARDCAEAGLRHIRICPIDYGSLSFATGSREESSEGGSDAIWDHLVRALSDPENGLSRDETADLAGRVQLAIQEHEGTGLGELHRRIGDVTRAIEASDSEGREGLRGRVLHFVAALNPALRRDLLRVTTDAPRDDESPADGFYEPELLDALEKVDRIGGGVPDQLLTLLNKLVRISHRQPDVAQHLEETLHRWGLSTDELSHRFPVLRDALEEIFQRRVEIDCNPEQYQALLENLARHRVGAHSTTSWSLYGDPQARDQVFAHLQEIAVFLLFQPDGAEYQPAVLAQLSEATGRLLAAGRFALVHEATVAARTGLLLRSAPDSARIAATHYLGEFESATRVNSVLDGAAASPEPPDAVFHLLRLGGKHAVGPALDRLRARLDPRLEEGLVLFLASREAAELREELDRRWEHGRAALRPLLRVCSTIEPNKGGPLLDRLLEHPDPRLRCETLRTICRAHTGSRGPERALRRALRDRSPRVVATAFGELDRVDAERATVMLGEYLAGEHGVHLPAPAFAARAAGHLLSRGATGRAWLERALGGLVWKLRPAALATAAAVLEVLQRGGAEDLLTTPARWSPGFLGFKLAARRRRGSRA